MLANVLFALLVDFLLCCECSGSNCKYDEILQFNLACCFKMKLFHMLSDSAALRPNPKGRLSAILYRCVHSAYYLSLTHNAAEQ